MTNLSKFPQILVPQYLRPTSAVGYEEQPIPELPLKLPLKKVLR
jgi:hypothetical protein